MNQKAQLIREIFGVAKSKIRIQKSVVNGVKVFVPANEKAIEIHDMMSPMQEVDCDYSFPRNPGNHRRFFAFLNLAFDAQDFYDNIHHFRKWLIGAAGHYTIIQTPKGGTIFDPDSIAWDNLDEPQFREVFSDCVNAYIKAFGKKIPDENIDEIIRF
jgi:hypothetical protein